MTNILKFFGVIIALGLILLLAFAFSRVSSNQISKGADPSGQVSSSTQVTVNTTTTQVIAGNGARNGLRICNTGTRMISCAPGQAAAIVNAGLILNVSSSDGTCENLNEASGMRWREAIQCISTAAGTSAVAIWQY